MLRSGTARAVLLLSAIFVLFFCWDVPALAQDAFAQACEATPTTGSAWDIIWWVLSKLPILLFEIIIEKIFELSVLAAGLIAILIIALVWALVKYGPQALKWYWDHPFWALVAALCLLTVLLIIVLILDVFCLAAPPAEGPMILLTLFLFLLWLFALILIIIALLRFIRDLLAWLFCSWIRTCIQWVTTRRFVCQLWATVQKRICVQRGVRCVQWATVIQAACPGGLLGRLCRGLLGVAKLICVATALVCIAWHTFLETVCKVGFWLIETFCKFWKWVLQC